MMKVLVFSFFVLFFSSNAIAWSDLNPSNPKELNKVYEHKFFLNSYDIHDLIYRYNLDCEINFNFDSCSDGKIIFNFMKNNDKDNNYTFLNEVYVYNEFRGEIYDRNSNFYKAFYYLLKLNGVKNHKEINLYFDNLLKRLEADEIIADNEYVFKNKIAINFYDTATYTRNLKTSNYKFYIYMKK